MLFLQFLNNVSIIKTKVLLPRAQVTVANSRACGSYQDFLDRGLLLTRKLLNLVKLKSSLRKFDRYGLSVSQITTISSTSRSFPHSWLITGFVTILKWRVPPVEQELFTLPDHLSSPQVLSGVRATRSLVLCVCFVDRCLSFCTFLWPLCCLSFDIRILITPLLSSNSSWLSCWVPLVLWLQETYKLFGFLMFWRWAYLMVSNVLTLSVPDGF
jgi:hypothetical protein